jgi:hypothetical protein
MKVTDLLFSRVENEQGELLGHLIDVRCEPLPRKTKRSEPEVTELLYGTAGLLESLGLREIKTEGIPWKSVLKVDRSKITVRMQARKKRQRWFRRIG